MPRKWTVRNYNAYLREMRRTYGLSHQAAQRAYAIQKQLTKGHPPLFGADVKRHPRQSAKAAKLALETRKLVEVTPRKVSDLLRRRIPPREEWEEYHWRVYET